MAPEDVPISWRCDKCDYLNDEEDGRCTECGAPTSSEGVVAVKSQGPISSGIFIRTWGAQRTGNKAKQLTYPMGVSVSPSGEVFVLSTCNDRVQVFRADGTLGRTWGSVSLMEVSRFLPPDVASVVDEYNESRQFIDPRGVAVSAKGEVYVADIRKHSIDVFRADGRFERSWGSVGNGRGQFNIPMGVTVSATGQVFVADYGNHRIQVFESDGTFVRCWGSNGNKPGEFSVPRGVAVSTEGEVFVADFGNNRVQVFSKEGEFVRQWGTHGIVSGSFDRPFGVAVSVAGEVFVSDYGNSRVQVFHTDGRLLRVMGSLGPAAGKFNEPMGVAISSTGELYVADSGNHRVQVFH